MRNFLTLREANSARQAEWDPTKQIDLDWRMNELAGEVGESCNVLKKLHRFRFGLPGSRATKDDLADELADVIICLDLVLMAAGCGPTKAVPMAGNLGSLTRAGHRLFSHASRFFTVLAFFDRREIESCSDRLHSYTDLIARNEGIDLDLAVSKKFNETTRKVGFQIFLRQDLTDN